MWLSLARARRSGLNHRSLRRIFEKSRKPLKTLTFSALPNAEKSAILRSDHMFDHLQKNTFFTPIGVWLSLVERLLREQEVGCSNHLTPTILVLYAQKISPFRKIRTDFLFVFYKSLLRRFCSFFTRAQVPGTRDRLESIFVVVISFFLKKSFSLLIATQILRGELTDNLPTNWNLILTFQCFCDIILSLK